MYFDPYKKIDFRLEYNDLVVMTGYLKVLTVSSEGYECSLNGELGKIFQEMQKITFDETIYDGEDKDKYWIDVSEYVNEKINKELVYDDWNTEHSSTILRKIGDEGYSVHNIIGFTPNNSFNTDFDYKTYQLNNDRSTTFTDTLESVKWNGKTFQDITGISPETVIGNGLTPRCFGEFRSYLQQPFIYWNQLWQIFQQKAESTTGYKFNLDRNWFNNNNPYWTKSVLTLMNYDQIQKQIAENTKQYECQVEYTGGKIDSKGQEQILKITSNAPYFVPDAEGGYFKALDNNKVMKISISNLMVSYVINGILKMTAICLCSGKYQYLGMPTRACHLYLDLVASSLDGKRDLKLIKRVIQYNIDCAEDKRPKDENADIIPVNYNDFATQLGDPETSTRWYSNIGAKTFYAALSDINEPFRLKLKMYYKHIGSTEEAIPLYDIVVKDPLTSTESNSFISNTEDRVIKFNNLDIIGTQYRSNSRFTLNTLWNNEWNPYKYILNYCKQFRILISVNDVNKTINFTKAQNYFSKYTISDFSDKLDKTKDYIINPIAFENKYILFNYEDEKTAIGEKYKNKFSYNFGDKKIDTSYSFNSNEKKLFSGINTGIISSYSDKSFKVLLGIPGDSTVAEPKVYNITPAEIFVNFSDKDNKQTDSFGRLLFARYANFDTNDNLTDAKISDDTNLQVYTDEYFYSDNAVKTDKYIQLDDVYDNKCILFNIPNENYTYNKTHYDNAISIYDGFWKNYIAERYNTQNKIVSCYLKLTPTDFTNFEFNRFITIENQLYFINKIYDYDISNINNSTKVELITIQNIEGYL